jgi:D-alanine-D-alanine ligase
MRIALLFSGRPSQVEPGTPDDAFEEYDTIDTVRAIEAALSVFGNVDAIDADRTLACRLANGSFDIAFNIAEGGDGRCREAHAAAVCEMLGLAATHSDSLTLGLTLDKMLTRRVVAPDVAVAGAALIREDDEIPSSLSLRFPVVVKPNHEGSSKGIRNDSYASTVHEARRLVVRLRETYRCPVLVEEYLPGPEVTVGVIGNGSAARVLGMMEIAPVESSGVFLYSVEVKRAFRERVRYFTPPRLAETTRREIEQRALTAYRLLGCRDVARLDFRLDGASQPRFLECNPLPGLNPDSSDLVIMSQSFLQYDELVRSIFREALSRYHLGAS